MSIVACLGAIRFNVLAHACNITTVRRIIAGLFAQEGVLRNLSDRIRMFLYIDAAVVLLDFVGAVVFGAVVLVVAIGYRDFCQGGRKPFTSRGSDAFFGLNQ